MGSVGVVSATEGVLDRAGSGGDSSTLAGAVPSSLGLTGSGVASGPSICVVSGGAGARATGGRVERTFRGTGGGMLAGASAGTGMVFASGGERVSGGGAGVSAAATGGTGAGRRESLNDVTSSTRPRATGWDRRSTSA